MRYLTEKDQIVQKIEEIIARESPRATVGDLELIRLVKAREILIGNDEKASENATTENATTETSVDESGRNRMISEFSRAFTFLQELKKEKDFGKAILGLIDVMLFILTVVTALSAKEADRSH